MNKLSRSLIILSIIPIVFSSCDLNKSDSNDSSDSNQAAAAEKEKSEIQKIRDITSSELVSEMRIGWCLGNTMDSTLGRTDGTIADYETGWGNVSTTEEMIQGVADAGFNVIRIPVSWGEHVSSDGNYTIDSKWMDRVNEIVDYGINCGMTVILNTHHEEWIFPDYAHLHKNTDELIKIWTQIGNRFEGYNENLIFEGLNEPRKRNTAVEWNGGDEEGQDVVNQLNAAFVKTIRGLDGNNPKRHLMIPTYAASSTTNALDSIKIPENDDKIIVSIHAYLPYKFALSESGTSQWNQSDASCTNEISQLMNNLKSRFIDKGTPVIIGEMGAVNRDNLEDRTRWAEYYIRTARECGIPCLWWDNGSYLGKGELFGIYSRKSGRWIFNDIVDGLMKGLDD